jgi:hypothetical protein
MIVVDGVDQLRGHPDMIARFLHAAFQHIANAEIFGRGLRRHRLAPIVQGRVARDHEQPGVLRQRVDEVVGQSIGEVVLRRIAAQIGKRKHRDRRLVGQRRGCASRGRRLIRRV